MAEANWGQNENALAQARREIEQLKGLLKEWLEWQAGSGVCVDLPIRTTTALDSHPWQGSARAESIDPA
jgi:hypothetical protein